MEAKQVNISVPDKLYSKMEMYVEEHGYRNAQDLFLDLVRRKVIFEDVDNLPLRDDFVEDMEKNEEFLTKQQSDRVYEELKRRANL